MAAGGTPRYPAQRGRAGAALPGPAAARLAATVKFTVPRRTVTHDSESVSLRQDSAGVAGSTVGRPPGRLKRSQARNLTQ